MAPLGLKVRLARRAIVVLMAAKVRKDLPVTMELLERKDHKVNAVVMELLVGKAHQGRKALKAPQDPALSLVSYKVD